ncbi:CHAT domain-containing protein [Nocardia sp. NPDC055029]
MMRRRHSGGETFEKLLARVDQRLLRHQHTEDPELVLGADAVADADALFQAVQPALEDRGLPDGNARILSAFHSLGWLHFARFRALPDHPVTEMARSLIFLLPLGKYPDLIPEVWRDVAAARSPADARAQARLGAELLAKADGSLDEPLLTASLMLLMASADALAAGTAEHTSCLSDLGLAFRIRFERFGETADLAKAITLGEQVVALSASDPELAEGLSRLGNAYGRRYIHATDTDDLDRAIALHERARALGDEAKPSPSVLFNLSNGYLNRYELNGVTADLEQALELVEQGLEIVSADDSRFPAFQYSLGRMCQRRYERTGVLGDIDRAIAAGEQAVTATPAGHSNLAGRLSTLSGAYRRRYERTRSATDLGRAVELSEQAVLITPEWSADLPVFLSNLGVAYRRQYERDRDPDTIERAVRAGERAVASLPESHTDQAILLTNLSLAHRLRAEHHGTGALFQQAVAAGEKALAATPDGHPDVAMHLSNLARAYLSRGRWAGRVPIRRLARRLRKANMAKVAPPLALVRAGWTVGVLAYSRRKRAAATELLDVAVAMLHSLVPKEAAWQDQEFGAGQHLGLVGDAIAAHCAIGDPVGALETAELGRGVVLAARMDSRTDLTDLAVAHPDLAEQFRQVRNRLNAPSASAEPLREPWAEYDRLLAQIRGIDRFAGFLGPPRFADLRAAAAGGPVILLNAGNDRSDAIILTADGSPRLLPLPYLSLEDVLAYSAILAGPAADRRDTLPLILGWLWWAAVEPVLDALAPAPGTRVWWLPTGLLGLFPLHAAGIAGRPGALDRVVSSYTPTLRALIHARARARAQVRRQLTVALASTPGLPDLRTAISEAETVHRSGTKLVNEQATVAEVLASLSKSTWAHFACHATADLSAPSNSGLHLYDGALSIPQISQLQLEQAELAYLSACSTANRGWLADEAVNLAAACQLAGYRHVVASLWPLNDAIAAIAARGFYATVSTDDGAVNAAAALHKVICDLRAVHPDRPDLWAPLIHTGP